MTIAVVRRDLHLHGDGSEIGGPACAMAGHRRGMIARLAALVAMALLAGCASTKVTNNERLVNERLPKPDRIIIYDFVTSAADMPFWSIR